MVLVQPCALKPAADSINAVEFAVFKEKKMSMDELIQLCDSNFENNEDLRQYLINRAPKYGNDMEEVEQRIADIVEKAGTSLSEH